MRDLLDSVISWTWFLFSMTMFIASGGNASWLADE
jgi:hypothetical protein